MNTCQMGVENANTKLYTSFWRTYRTIPTWPSKNLFHNSLFRVKRGSTTSILSQSNKACNRTNESVIFILNRTRSGQELFDHPSYSNGVAVLFRLERLQRGAADCWYVYTVCLHKQQCGWWRWISADCCNEQRWVYRPPNATGSFLEWPLHRWLVQHLSLDNTAAI